MGKGIIIPVKIFVKRYLAQIQEIYTDGDDEVQALEQIVKKYIGEQYCVSSLGHDALESRHGNMQVLDGTTNMEAFELLQKMKIEAKDMSDDLPILSLHCGDLMFIGHYESLGSSEFEYYIKTPEVLYGLPALIPDIIRCYSKYIDMDCSQLQTIFEQNPCIWTFAPDCHCCG